MKFPFPLLLAPLLIIPAFASAESRHEHDHDHHDAHHGAANKDHREHAAHVHGKGRVTVAMQGKSLEIMLESPAESFFGFEHTPSTPTEQAKVDKALEQLKDAKSLFGFEAAAACKNLNTEIDAPFAQPAKTPTDGHADVSATYTFECNHPEKLTTLSLPLLKVFPALRNLTVDYVTENSQGSQTATADQPILTLK